MKRLYCSFVVSLTTYFLFITILIIGCSREKGTYDDLSLSGEVETLARKRYAKFFKAVKTLREKAESTDEAVLDSTFVKNAGALTDRLIEDLRKFPSTLQSRIALDALSYGANDLAESPNFSKDDVPIFWHFALLEPIFVKGFQYVKSGSTNESTHLQIVKALQRGMGNKATDEMLLNIITLVGPAPPEQVLEVCKSDSLALRKAYDLIMYSRSFQTIGPPAWMITGNWFLVVDIEGWPMNFFCLKPLLINDLSYLTFKDYNHGEVYAAVFDDPVPDESSRMDAWLTRASAVMNSLSIDETFADMIRKSELPTYDTHNYYNEYLLFAQVDSVKKEFKLIIKSDRLVQNSFQFSGADSIEVVFTQNEINSPAEKITRLYATRWKGSSMNQMRFTHEQKNDGTAYLMPLGVHDDKKLKDFQKLLMPEINVTTVTE